MFQRCSLLFVAVLAVMSQASQAHFPEYCAECEQEVWEQVPCSEIPTTTAMPTTPGTGSTPSTARPPTTTTSLPVTTRAPVTPATSTTEPPSAYKKCYCECKLGCKEFCRKVVSSNPRQPLTQISSIGEYVAGGQVEFSHVHQRKYFPKYAGEGYTGAVGGPKAYKPPYPLAYEREGAEASPAVVSSVSSSPSVASIAAPNYTLEELAQLLSTAYGGKKAYPAPSRPQLQPAPVASPSVYYSPVYRQGPVEPILSKVLPAPKRTSGIKYAAAAVAASNGVSLAKIKTPYEEKVVVATAPTIYDRTTSYPIVEEVQKVYSQTESYPSQTESYPSVTPIYPSPTESYPSLKESYPSHKESYPSHKESYPSHKESYPSHKESYPSHKDSYPSITESYPSQTESYPSNTESYPSPQPEAKSYGGLESGADKPSSTFDLAIDNYLKDFGYGNQGRGYGDY